MERWNGKVAVVTGASSGIGEAVARELVHQGMVVVGMARRIDRIEKLQKELSQSRGAAKLYAFKTDVSKQEDIVTAFDWVEAELGGADVLVNNAGVFNFSTIEDGSYEEWKTLVDVNLFGYATCTREFLKSLKTHQKEDAHIININSVVARTTFISHCMYSASKAAAITLSQGLRHQLAERRSKIKVTDICPGQVKTEILHSLGKDDMFDEGSFMVPKDIAVTVTGVLAASPVTQICEVLVTPVPTSPPIY